MKVGDYIHYKFSNYRANGVSVYDGKSANPTQVFKNQKMQFYSLCQKGLLPIKIQLKQL